MGRRKTVGGAALVVGLLVAGGVGTHLAFDDSRPSDAPAAADKVATTPVVRTTLSDYWTETGTVGYLKQRTLTGVSSGVITWLPRSGASVSRGEVLFHEDDRPVVLFYGVTPLFRDLDTVGMVGRDVAVLADNLRAMGYDIGYQPPPGTTVSVPGPADSAAEDVAPGAMPAATADDGSTSGPAPVGASKAAILGPGRSADFVAQGVRPVTSVRPTRTPSQTPAASAGGGEAAPATPAPTYQVRLEPGVAVLTQSLKDAVQRWQGDIGTLPPTGDLLLGDALVQPGPLRIGAMAAALGDPADGNVMVVSGQHKAVTVDIDASRADDVRSGQKVQLTLPDSSKTTGTIDSVSTEVQSDDSGDGSGDGSGAEPPQVAVVVLVDKTSALRNITSASVEVQFTGTTAKHVLAVPVGALLALSEGGYGVQIANGPLAGVQVGLFADGMVEVTGDGLTEGVKVVTTS